MEIFSDVQVAQLVSTIVFFILGFVLFALSIWVMEKLTPFSIKREIIDEHNISMAIVIAAMVVAIAIILAAVID